MSINTENYKRIISLCQSREATLVAVSKTKPIEDILELYKLGQRHFGENYVQELIAKQEALPKDICWHFIGHLQTNKVRFIAPFIHLIHGVDSAKLLNEIEKQGAKIQRKIPCLLQVFIATEETKFGLDKPEVEVLLQNPYVWAEIRGLMGMASNTPDLQQVKKEFDELAALFRNHLSRPGFDQLSMGMSADFELALDAGSNMIRVGSLLFGAR